MENCNHCSHGTGQMLTSNPPQIPEVCCHCGERRNVTYGYVDNSVHGKYKPTTYQSISTYLIGSKDD